MKMEIFEIEIFEIFRSQKFSDDNFKLLQLFSFSIKLFDFFIDRCGFSVRTRFFDPKVLKKSLERIKCIIGTLNFSETTNIPTP